MPDASVVHVHVASGMIQSHSGDIEATYAGEMRKQNKKQQLASGDALVMRLKAKTKQDEVLREIFPEHVVDDPREVERILRGTRRNAKWNPKKKRA